jgi:excinuclease ABC subunit C
MLVWQIALGLGILLLWELLVQAGILDPFFFSRPSAILRQVWEWVSTGSIFRHLYITMLEALLSFVIGAVLGVIFGFLLARTPFLSKLFDPYISMLNALPRVVLAPIFMLWFGLGIWSKVALGVTLVFFIVFYNTYQGVKDVELFLSGRQDRLLREMERQMEAAAEDLQFERAAKLRDQLSAIKTIAERQKVVNTTQGDQDVIAVVNDEAGACVQMFFIRGGKLIGQEHFLLEGTEGDSPSGADRGLEEATAEFVKQYYQDASFVPSEILLPAHVEEMEIIESWLRQKKGARVSISVPERGEKKNLVEMAATNAKLALEQVKAQSAGERDRADSALRELARALDLPEDNRLTRIEAYDISNVQGRHAVGGMIVFERGQAKKSEYRRFKIEQETGEPNDFAMMYEVLTRRFNQMAENNPKFTEEPDLILIDGGKGQLSAAQDAMRQFGYDFPMIGLAKQFEQVFVPGRGEPVELPRSSPALFLLQRVRDEVHRYAITYHRNVRGRAAQMSVLDEIPGIGPARRRALLKYFGSVEKMRQASAADLAKAPGMNGRVAQELYEYLRGTGGAAEPARRVSG